MNIDSLPRKEGRRIEPLYLHERDPLWLIVYLQGEVIEKIELRLERPDGRPSRPRIAAKLRTILSDRVENKTALKFHVSGTPFQKAVWAAACGVPAGCLTTYGAIFKTISRGSPRAVGQALKKNPLPIIIPCHRIIGRDGSLTGFSSGMEIKRMLIEFESIDRFRSKLT